MAHPDESAASPAATTEGRRTAPSAVRARAARHVRCRALERRNDTGADFRNTERAHVERSPRELVARGLEGHRQLREQRRRELPNCFDNRF